MATKAFTLEVVALSAALLLDSIPLTRWWGVSVSSSTAASR